MGFISYLRQQIAASETVDDLTGSREFAEFSFIGIRETALTIDIFAFVKADGLSQTQISELCDKFFNITRAIAYGDFGLSPGPRNPNSLLGFVFEDRCSDSLVEFIKTQSRIEHWRESAVTVPWTIDVKGRRIYTHRNPVSLLPPVMISKGLTYPKLSRLRSLLSSYQLQKESYNDTAAILASFKSLESKVEAINRHIRSDASGEFRANITANTTAGVIQNYIIYINSRKIETMTTYNTGDTYNVGQAGAVGRHARSDNNRFVQPQQNQTLAEAAAEIQQLLEQLEQNQPAATEAQTIAYLKDETTPSLRRRVANALKEGGEAALDEFVLENKYLKVTKAVVKGWLQSD